MDRVGEQAFPAATGEKVANTQLIQRKGFMETEATGVYLFCFFFLILKNINCGGYEQTESPMRLFMSGNKTHTDDNE